MFVQSHDIDTHHLHPAHHLGFMRWQQSTLHVNRYLQAEQTLYFITLAIARGILPGHTTRHMPPMPAGTLGIMDHVGTRFPSEHLCCGPLHMSPLISSLCGHLSMVPLLPWPLFTILGVHGDVCYHQ